MQGKQRAIFYFIVVFFILLCSWCASCAGTRPVIVATDESIVSSQISAEKLAGINGELRTILQLHDEFIRREIELARRGNYEAEAALDLYDEFVQGLIYRIRELERATRSVDNEISDAIPDSDYWTNPFLD